MAAARCAEPLYYRSGWDEVWRVYGLRCHRLAARRGGEVVGFLRLVEQRSRVTGNQLVALPWFDAAGIVADDDEAARCLADAAIDAAERAGADFVQLRQDAAADLSPAVRTDKVLMRLSLESSAGTLWDRLKGKVRNQVRKGEKSGLKFVSGGNELLGEFFRVYSRNMRDLGSPSHSRAFFRGVLGAFRAEARVHIVRSGGRAVGGGLTLANGGTLEIPWASSLKSHNSLCVNHWLYWNLLARACDEGYESFHFGRSTRGSGQHHFKSQWGAEEAPLYWYFLARDPAQAAAAAAPPGERLGWGPRLWRRLPVCVTRRIGPRLIAGLP